MADIPENDVRAWQAGRKSLSDLAAAAGVSKQAIAQKLKRRGITRHATTGSQPAGAASPPAGDPIVELMQKLQAAPDRETWLREVATFADSISLNLLGQLHALASGENATSGAQQLKLVTQALTSVLENLEHTGRITSGEDAQLESMRIVVMSPAEEAEIRERAEAEAQGMLDPDDTRQTAADGSQTPAKTPVGSTPADDAEPGHTPATDGPSDDHALRDPLRRLADRQGVQRLRSLALSVGAPAPRDRDALVDALVERADDDPDAAAAIQAAISRSSP